MVRQEQERLGAHAGIGIFSNALDGGRCRVSAASSRTVTARRRTSAKGRSTAPAPPDASRLCVAPEEIERIQDSAGSLADSRAASSSVADRSNTVGYGALGVEPVLGDALADRLDVPVPQGDRPTRVQHPKKQQVTAAMPRSPRPAPGILNATSEKPGRRQAEENAADAVGETIQDQVDGRLHVTLDPGADRQVEELEGGLVHREPQALVERARDHHRPEDCPSAASA